MIVKMIHSLHFYTMEAFVLVEGAINDTKQILVEFPSKKFH